MTDWGPGLVSSTGQPCRRWLNGLSDSAEAGAAVPSAVAAMAMPRKSFVTVGRSFQCRVRLRSISTLA